LAPVLSATRSRDSCWITSTPTSAARSLGLLDDLDDPPPLRRRQRAGLHEPDPVADAAGVGLVMRVVLARPPDRLAVQRVLDPVFDGDDDGLVHLVADDKPLTGLPETAGAR